MRNEIELLINQPRESLSVEIKGWLDLDKNIDRAKIIKTLLALRNSNGGFMVFGFNDKTLKQDLNAPANPHELFHTDKIQGWITKYASESFEVDIYFAERDGIKHPVLIVPGGIKSIVAAKADLIDENGNKLICVDDVYIRSLSSNNTPSTTKAKWKDWPSIIEVCFDNREADIGKFLRRHLGGFSREDLVAALDASDRSIQQIAQDFYDKSIERYDHLVKERNLELPEHGSWISTMVINGTVPPFRANKEFLRMLDKSNPNYTGWPLWLNSEDFTDEAGHPQVFDGVWESLLVKLKNDWHDYIDFYRFDPKGKFFSKRALEDDIGASANQPAPNSELDLGLVIIRVAEAIAVGLAFAKAMECPPESTKLFFMFTWDKLKGRLLSAWANPRRHSPIARVSYQDQVCTTVEVPLDTPLSRLGEYVKTAIDPLFEGFNDFVISQAVVDELVTKLVNRRLAY